MSKQHPTAYVVVSSRWFREVLGTFLVKRSRSDAAAETHLITGPVLDRDAHGIWLSQIESELFFYEKGGKPVLMDVMIPGREVLGLAVVDESSWKGRVAGFGVSVKRRRANASNQRK